MQIQGHALQLEMQRGAVVEQCVCGIAQPSLGVCPPLCSGAGEHPWVLCTPHQAGPFPGAPEPLGMSRAWRDGSFPGWGH